MGGGEGECRGERVWSCCDVMVRRWIEAPDVELMRPECALLCLYSPSTIVSVIYSHTNSLSVFLSLLLMYSFVLCNWFSMHPLPLIRSKFTPP